MSLGIKDTHTSLEVHIIGNIGHSTLQLYNGMSALLQNKDSVAQRFHHWPHVGLRSRARRDSKAYQDVQLSNNLTQMI